MTSHWNLPPTPMSHPSHAYHHTHPSSSNTGGGGSAKSKYAHLGQYGVSRCRRTSVKIPVLFLYSWERISRADLGILQPVGHIWLIGYPCLAHLRSGKLEQIKT